jgi:stalled ribosome alternative rescue factor ArfA
VRYALVGDVLRQVQDAQDKGKAEYNRDIKNLWCPQF